MKKYTKTNILFSIGIVLILILFFIFFIPISNFVLKTTNNALKEGTFKKYESEFRMEFLKGKDKIEILTDNYLKDKVLEIAKEYSYENIEEIKHGDEKTILILQKKK